MITKLTDQHNSFQAVYLSALEGVIKDSSQLQCSSRIRHSTNTTAPMMTIPTPAIQLASRLPRARRSRSRVFAALSRFGPGKPSMWEFTMPTSSSKSLNIPENFSVLPLFKYSHSSGLRPPSPG